VHPTGLIKAVDRVRGRSGGHRAISGAASLEDLIALMTNKDAASSASVFIRLMNLLASIPTI
jgi:hypothetical protein